MTARCLRFRRTGRLLSRCCLLGLAALVVRPAAARAETALEKLQAAPKPRFRKGHTLPPLTRWGWTMPFEVRVELAELWGYALELGGYVTDGLAKELDDPKSITSRICALAATDPKRYPLCALTMHGDFGELPDAAWCGSGR